MISATGIEWQPELTYAAAGLIAGLLAGLVLAGIIFWLRLIKLERRNAELTMQVKAERAALERAGAELDLRFRATAQEALARSGEQFLQVAQEKLGAANKDSAHDLEKRQKAIESMVDPVNKALSQMDEKIQLLEKARLSAYTELQTHLKSMTEDQLKLRRETATLVQALRSPATRGQWGEMQLRRCLEMAGMQAGIHFEEQVTANSGQRPDIIIKMTGGKTIVIDAKAPIEGYLDALKDGITEEERNAALDRHARHVKGHIRALGTKAYQEEFNTPEFVIMFLPGESYFSAALERDPSLIEAGVDQKVIPASPTTLISLLKAVMYGWRQEALAENAKQVSDLGSELYKSIAVFSGHVQKVGRGLSTAMGAYNDAIGSLERNVLTRARKFEDLKVAPSDKTLDAIEPVDHAIRRLNAPDVMEPDESIADKLRA
jgi:DNA recombination protein RmuC